jgi:hypothetical protein
MVRVTGQPCRTEVKSANVKVQLSFVPDALVRAKFIRVQLKRMNGFAKEDVTATALVVSGLNADSLIPIGKPIMDLKLKVNAQRAYYYFKFSVLEIVGGDSLYSTTSNIFFVTGNSRAKTATK